jgi:folate-binding protein YgfZ
MSTTHLRADLGVVFIRGSDAVSFVDGLSTNLIPTAAGSAVRTVFTDRAAKIIAATTAMVREEGVVLLVHRDSIDALMNHLQPRQLGQDVALMDLSTRNHVLYEMDPETDLAVGAWRTVDGVTTARVHEALCMHVIAGTSKDDEADDIDAWTAWRVEHRWPEHGIEITPARHPLACGLDSLVHENKGCYLGQEVLTRMRSRGKTGWALVQGSADDFAAETITTQSKGQALAIVRTRDLQ